MLVEIELCKDHDGLKSHRSLGILDNPCIKNFTDNLYS